MAGGEVMFYVALVAVAIFSVKKAVLYSTDSINQYLDLNDSGIIFEYRLLSGVTVTEAELYR